MSDRDRFQGKCLYSKNGYLYMNIYDAFPKEARLRLQSSDYNLCAACVSDIQRLERITHLSAIDQMEAQIRASEAASNPQQ